MSYAMTWTDLFCGAGGSSTGAMQVPGVTVRMAANHWRLAVETHNTNHPGYVVLGNKRERVRQLGNAVTPPTARDLIAATAACIGHEIPDFDTFGQAEVVAA